jgi:hypothetical protein
MAKQVPLTRGQVAIVDDEDYERVMAAGPWHVYLNKHMWYPRRRVGKRHQPLANFVLGTVDSCMIDHIDHNGLNNCKHNLREVSYTENNHNRRKQHNTTSTYYGVSRSTSGDSWEASIRKDGKYYYIGKFRDQLTAARAYDNKARELYGVMARLNFSDDANE